MKNKLMTMLDFCFWALQRSDQGLVSEYEYFGETFIDTQTLVEIKLYLIQNHAKFLCQPPELKHFIRVGENGEILEEPQAKDYHQKGDITPDYVVAKDVWVKAGEPIFKGELTEELYGGSGRDLYVRKTGPKGIRIWVAVLNLKTNKLEQQRFNNLEDVIRSTNE